MPDCWWQAVDMAPGSPASTVDTAPLTPQAERPFLFQKCWHCEPAFGETDPTCRAIQVLGTLEKDMDEQEEKILAYQEVSQSQTAKAAPLCCAMY